MAKRSPQQVLRALLGLSENDLIAGVADVLREILQAEATRRDRIRAGQRGARAAGKRIGRAALTLPAIPLPAGCSVRRAGRILGCSKSTAWRRMYPKHAGR